MNWIDHSSALIVAIKKFKVFIVISFIFISELFLYEINYTLLEYIY